MITAASMASSVLFAPSAGAVDIPQTFQGDSETVMSLTQSEGQWARQYAAEMLERYPKLQTNPYAVLAKFTSDASISEINQLLSEIGATVVDHFPHTNMYLLETVEGNINAKNFFSASDLIDFVEFDQVIRADNISNDPRIGELWGLIGNNGINASGAWNISSSASEVVVAVIDSGVDITHPDLSSVIWTNQDEIAGNGIDDDGNGYIDDTNGWGFCLQRQFT